jgi:excisionase family DNA binding protein
MQSIAQRREELMRVKEVARALDQHPATIYRKIAAGMLPAVRLGDEHAAIRVRRAELEAWLGSSGLAGASDPMAGAPSREAA